MKKKHLVLVAIFALLIAIFIPISISHYNSPNNIQFRYLKSLQEEYHEIHSEYFLMKEQTKKTAKEVGVTGDMWNTFGNTSENSRRDDVMDNHRNSKEGQKYFYLRNEQQRKSAKLRKLAHQYNQATTRHYLEKWAKKGLPKSLVDHY